MVFGASFQSVQVDDPPVVNRFSPTCIFALVEAVVAFQFGVPNISKAWFDSAFRYRSNVDERWLADDGVSLDVRLTVGDHGFARAVDKLRRHYGVTLDEVPHTDFAALVADIEASLRRRELVISSFDKFYMAGCREYRRTHGYHVITPIALSREPARLKFVDNFSAWGAGAIEVDLAEYAASFEFSRSAGRPFTLTRCRRIEAYVERPFTAREVRADLAACLENLASTDGDRGLAALERGVRDVTAAVAALDRPFVVPDLWIFQSDRHNYRLNLQHWCASGLVREASFARFDEHLAKVARLWAAANMICEAAVSNEGSLKDMAEIPSLLARLVPLEHASARFFEQLLLELPA